MFLTRAPSTKGVIRTPKLEDADLPYLRGRRERQPFKHATSEVYQRPANFVATALLQPLYLLQRKVNQPRRPIMRIFSNLN